MTNVVIQNWNWILEHAKSWWLILIMRQLSLYHNLLTLGKVTQWLSRDMQYLYCGNIFENIYLNNTSVLNCFKEKLVDCLCLCTQNQRQHSVVKSLTTLLSLIRTAFVTEPILWEYTAQDATLIQLGLVAYGWPVHLLYYIGSFTKYVNLKDYYCF